MIISKNWRINIGMWEICHDMNNGSLRYVYEVLVDAVIIKHHSIGKPYRAPMRKVLVFRGVPNIVINRDEFYGKYKGNKYSVPLEYDVNLSI